MESKIISITIMSKNHKINQCGTYVEVFYNSPISNIDDSFNEVIDYILQKIKYSYRFDYNICFTNLYERKHMSFSDLIIITNRNKDLSDTLSNIAMNLI